MRWRGDSVCILASGPSLTRADAHYAKTHLDHVIAVNESWRVCRDADVCYGADSTWWIHRGPPPDAGEFTGERWTQDKQWGVPRPRWLHCIESRAGRQIAPPGSKFVYTGHNSAFQALGLAVVWGATDIVFLGLDLQCAADGANHWHEDHPAPLVNARTAYPTFIKAFTDAKPFLDQMGVRVVNASRVSALKAYPRLTLAEACAVARAHKRGVPLAADPAKQDTLNSFYDPDGDGDP